MRKPHILEPSKQTIVPRRMIFFDSESEVSTEITQEEISRAIENKTGKGISKQVRKEHKPYYIAATYYRDRQNERGRISEKDEDYYPLKDGETFLEKFWQDVDNFAQKGQKTFIFAHNAKYDVQVTGCVPFLVALGYTVKSFSDANPFFLKFVKEFPTGKINEKNGKEIIIRKHIIIVSSTNYYAQPLAKLGETFGLPKLDFNHDQKILPKSKAFMEKVRVYGRRDVDILKTAMLSFISFVQREGLGKFAMTVAGQSFAAYCKRFMLEDIYIHDDARALETERNAYAGGRNECFSIGAIDQDIYYVDINSMYPHVMRTHKYPTKLITFWNQCSIDQVEYQINSGRLICADVLVHTDIPIFHKKDDRLIFPIGTFWTSLSTPEIIEGLKRGFIKEMKNVCVYESGDLFSEYVNYFYNARLEAKHNDDAVHDNLHKMMLTNLYGKFGQRNENWEKELDEDGKEIEVDPCIVMEKTELNHQTRERETFRIFGGRVFARNKELDDMEAQNSFPAIAAHVTAHARQLLWSYIEMAGMEHVHYCDTDSLFVDATGYQLLWLNDAIDNDRLGALKIEQTKEMKKLGLICMNDLALFGCKDYQFAGVTKIKGVSKNAVRLADSEDGKLRFAVTQWGGFADRFREGDMSHYFNKVIVKELAREYTKGIIFEGRVLPFTLDEREEASGSADGETLLLCLPSKGDKHFPAYRSLPLEIKTKHFRRDAGLTIEEWEAQTGTGFDTLVKQLNCQTI